MVYLTAIRFTPGGSNTVHINTQTIHRTNQSTQTIHRTTQFIHRTTQFVTQFVTPVLRSVATIHLKFRFFL